MVLKAIVIITLSSATMVSGMYGLKLLMDYIENYLRQKHFDKIKRHNQQVRENRVKYMFNHSINSTK